MISLPLSGGAVFHPRHYPFDWVPIPTRAILGTQASIPLELETKVKRRFPKVSIVSYSRPSLMIIALQTQFHVERPWGQHPFSIVS